LEPAEKFDGGLRSAGLVAVDAGENSHSQVGTPVAGPREKIARNRGGAAPWVGEFERRGEKIFATGDRSVERLQKAIDGAFGVL
jgi:hypothetical protein